MCNEGEGRKPVTSGISNPNQEERDAMALAGIGIDPFAPGLNEHERAYRPYRGRQELVNAITKMLDDAIIKEVVTTSQAPGVLDECKPKYLAAVHAERKLRESQL